MPSADHIQVLSPEEVKLVLKSITQRDQNVVARLLIEGLSVSEILAIRVRDLKPVTNCIICHRPRRRVAVSRISMSILVEIANRRNLHGKSTAKVISFKERNIRHFIGEAGELSGVGNISPKTLQNTFIPWTLLMTPRTPLSAFHNQLGYKDPEYTKRVIREAVDNYKKRFGVELVMQQDPTPADHNSPGHTDNH